MQQLPKVLLSSNSLSSGLIWQFRLQAQNLSIVMEPNLAQVIERALVENPDLILLDFGSVDEVSLQLLGKLREQQACPLIILVASSNADSALDMYEAGVDDCIIKPIEVMLFAAKINAWLRRRMVMPVEMLNPMRVGRVYLDPPEKELTVSDRIVVRLTNIEVRLLYVMMSHYGRTIQTDELIALVWKNKEEVCRAILKNTIYRLRQKLESEPANLHCIYTVTGFGYKFDLTMKPGTGKLIPPDGSETFLNVINQSRIDK